MVVVTLPVAVLFAFLTMRLLGIQANLMALAGIAIAIGATEVGPAIFFSLLVITVSFLPVFGLEAQEGRLFRPLAFTKTFAMAGAAVLAVTLISVTLGLFVRGRVRS